MSIDPNQLLQWLATAGAGFLAGAINVMVGAGTLVSFPILVLLGHPPLAATVANTVGIVPGSLSGVAVYRKELRRRAGLVRLLLPASLLGAVGGSLLLLHLSAGVFQRVIPWLIGVGTVLVVLGPAIRRRIDRSRRPRTRTPKPRTPQGTATEGSSSASNHLATLAPPATATPPAFASRAALVGSVAGALLLGVYGGYFSAAQGVLLIALLGITSALGMQELNAVKNLTVACVNVVAAVVFMVVSPALIDWGIVAPLAVGSTLGGLLGGRFARRLPAPVFRGFVVVVGVATVAMMALRG